MNDFKDTCSEFPLTIDVGGELYYLGSEKPAELAYKSRADFLKSFGTDPAVECLLRKYLYFSLKPRSQLRVDTADKAELIKILKIRASQLKASQEFSSSVLKNTTFKRTFLNIQKLIQDIQGIQGIHDTNNNESLFSLSDILPCTKAKKHIKQIPPERQQELLLAMAWYLLHPELTPKNVECDWAKLVKQLDTLNISDLVTRVKQGQANFTNSGTPYNYFKKMNSQVGGSEKKGNHTTLDEAKEMALSLRGEIAKKESENRIKSILEAMEANKFLKRNAVIEEYSSKIISGGDADVLHKIVSRGGGNTNDDTLNTQINVSMKPLFDYFKGVYDPLYSFLEPITKYDGPDMKTIMLPQLLALLYICNNIKPTESTAGGAMSYGIYHITNVSKEILTFVNHVLRTTETKVEGFSDDKNKRQFNQEISSLPKVRLSSIINDAISGGIFGIKEPETPPCIQLFSLGNNLSLLPEDEFMADGGKEIVYNALTDLFNENDLYIICSKSRDFSTTPTNIPINVFEIDFSTIDV